MKPKVVMIADVRGWGGWNRAQMIKKHLSDEFDFTLTIREEFRKNRAMYKDYDSFYPLFHTMMNGSTMSRIAKERKLITIVTGRTTMKPIFRNKSNLREKLKNCTAVAANNMIAYRDLKKNFDGHTFYVPRGVDMSDFYRTKWERDKEFTALYVGKPVEPKGLEQFIRPACKKAGIKLIANTRNYKTALNYEQMNDLYNECHVYMVASIIDGTPNPALEAAATGRAIISNEIGNMPEFIKDGWNGFLVDRNIDSYVEKLKLLKNDMRLTNKMGCNARKMVKREWQWHKTLEYERKMLRSVLYG